jgi:hypothetical protein
MGLVTQIAAERTSSPRFELLETFADVRGLGFRHDADGGKIAFILEALDVVGRQELGHHTLLH